jgi:hypothetical protein
LIACRSRHRCCVHWCSVPCTAIRKSSKYIPVFQSDWLLERS